MNEQRHWPLQHNTKHTEADRGFYDPGRIVAFLIAHVEISCQSTFATFPSLHFPHVTATLPQHGIVQFHDPCTSKLHHQKVCIQFSHPAISRCRGVELVDSIHAQNASPHHAEMRDESAKSKGNPPNPTAFAVQFVPGLLTTPLSSGNTPPPPAHPCCEIVDFVPFLDGVFASETPSLALFRGT